MNTGSAQPALRILVVDDHPSVRSGLTKFLEHEPDLDVIGTASNGVEALAAAARLRPDLVLMDVSMPGMDGIETTRQLVARNPELRVVMLTSVGGHSHMVEALRCGASAYVVKDAAPAEVLRAVRTVAFG